MSYDIACVLGVHFRAGEWGKRRCGSVFTTIYGGRSRYCVVNKFIRVGAEDFARVTWLSIPRYPYSPNPLVCRVRHYANGGSMSTVVPLTKIDPTPVLVEPDSDGVHYFMMRMKGYDRPNF